MRKARIGDFLTRSKIPVDIQDDVEYKRVTIKINHNGVSLRDREAGSKIGTKKQFILREGQFIVSKIDARYGAFGIAPREVEGAIITGNFWAYDVDIEQVNIDWFNQFTNSTTFYDLCERASSGITHRKYLDEKIFLNFEILLPTVDEQLSQIDWIKGRKLHFGELNLILTHQLSLVKQLRQAFLREAMQGKLLSQDPNDEPASELLRKIKAEKEQLIKDKKLKKEKPLPPIKPEEIPFEIPENWVWCRLGEIALYSESGKSFKAIETPANDSELGVIKTSAITTGIFLEAENKLLPNQKIKIDKIKIEHGDFLVCRASGSKGLAGKSCIVRLASTRNLVLSDKSIRFAFSQYISKDYIQGFNSSTFATNYYQRLGTGKSTSMNNITREQFNHLAIPLPPLSEQLRIVEKLDQLMQLCDGLEQSIAQSQQQNEMLLQQVLREALEPKGEVVK